MHKHYHFISQEPEVKEPETPEEVDEDTPDQE